MPTRTRPQIDPQEGFGRAIKALRAEQGVSQEGLADRCEMSRAQLSKVERGLADLRLSTVFRLASALDVSAAELIGRTEDILKASSKRRAGA
jgi:transcriptional regulator with XRE-family HTH domain